MINLKQSEAFLSFVFAIMSFFAIIYKNDIIELGYAIALLCSGYFAIRVKPIPDVSISGSQLMIINLVPISVILLVAILGSHEQVFSFISIHIPAMLAGVYLRMHLSYEG